MDPGGTTEYGQESVSIREDSENARKGAAAALIFAFAPAQERPQEQGFSFRSNVNLINVTVTVTDSNGRFVNGLTKDDFDIYEDGVLQQTSHFDAERVPVSLGLAVDTSGSMVGDKWEAAQAALGRFLNDLLGSQDEVFLYRFSERPELVQPWTSDRRDAGRRLVGVQPRGGTAMPTPWPRPFLWRSGARGARRRWS